MINKTIQILEQQPKIIPYNNIGEYFISVWNKEPTIVRNNFKIVDNRFLLYQEEIPIPDDIELPMYMLMLHLSGNCDVNGLRPIDESMIKIMRSIGMDMESLVS